MEQNNNKYLSLGLVLGVSLILSASIGAFTFYKLRSMDYISTTGSAKKAVVSDKVKWSGSITRPVKASGLKEGYAKLETDLKEVKEFLATNNIPAEAIDVSPVFMNEVWEQNPGTEKSYNLMQNIEVQSTEVQKVGDLAKNVTTLVQKGILFSTNSLEYYYSKLPEVRVELLANAVGDAKARAEQLAIAGGKSIGALKSASSGVVQVMAPNSVEVSDYGMYDTSKINKEIMVTVKASFEIK
ncbi:MAG: SIMPL domain-containing protein [Candidatus Pacebacteria bacterium]|nr:SIMPL domain-containing protein [Candidatus Paceibacterota bacterium]MCF7862528.1 SIMPL domain-containing protein [Candidatus Paceibacterota bacterium]